MYPWRVEILKVVGRKKKREKVALSRSHRNKIVGKYKFVRFISNLTKGVKNFENRLFSNNEAFRMIIHFNCHKSRAIESDGICTNYMKFNFCSCAL